MPYSPVVPANAKTLLIASYLEPLFVDQIQRVNSRLEVLYSPQLLAPPRYLADHTGAPFARTADQELQWRTMLARVQVLFDFDRPNASELPKLAPRLEWIQATSAGIGEYVRRHGYSHSMPHVAITTASGVHAQPLAEFCFMVLIAFHKRLPRMLRDQRDKRWERFAAGDLRGQTLVIVGVGGVGREVARLGKAFGMRVIGVKRSLSATPAHELHLDELYGPPDLGRALEQAQNLVLVAPHTPETEGMSAPASWRGFRMARCWSTWAAARSSMNRRSSPRSSPVICSVPASTSFGRSRCPPTVRFGR
jgi:hypothetical protein